MPLLRRVLLSLALLALAGAALATPGAQVTTPQVQAELLAHAPQGVAPGQPLWLGLRLQHQPGWHTYWKNPGDSGLPTQLDWTLPPGVSAGEIAWPVPHKIPLGSLANYGHEGTLLLPVPLHVAPDFRPAGTTLDVRLKARWLVCRQECIPEEGEFALQLPLQGSTALHGALFEAARQAEPRPLAGPARVQVAGRHLEISVQGLPAAARGRTLDLFPETPEVIHTAAELGTGWTQAWQGAVWTARVPLSEQRSASPDTLPLVLALQGQATQGGWRVEAPVSGAWPATAPSAEVSPALQAALDQARAEQPAALASSPPATTLWAGLLGALLGGLILNLMPCVFPVLALKVFGFARHGRDRRAQALGGLAYTAGVVLSFLALGGLLLALRAGGEAVGWGFQLQSPAVVAVLAALFTVIGLNLAGLFEFGSVLPSGLASLQARHPVLDAGLSGVLAVAVASPCTAPFMGASLGLAVSLPAAQALLLFSLLGLGLALPYLLASLWPGLARALPRPGPWMDTLRRFMAFPMLATVVWLVWVLGQQSGIDGAASLLALLVALAMGLWSLGLQGRSRTLIALVSIASFVLLARAWGPNIVASDTASGPEAVAAPAARWQAWAPGRVEQALASGQPVFVDFTAAWCVTCQYNKKTTLANAQVLADLDAKRVLLLRADWTRRDPAITAALAQLGRSGVPVYVLQRPGAAPQVLSEVLGVDELRAAIARL